MRLSEIIRKSGSKWTLRTRGDGRTLGTHDTKQEAEDQETAINISKAKRKGKLK